MAVPWGGEEVDMTKIEERIQEERERSKLLRKELACECPDTSCPVEHET